MSQELAAPVPRLTVITLGVSDIRASIAFYDALGFARRLKATDEVVAFYDTGGPVLALDVLDDRPDVVAQMLAAGGLDPTEDAHCAGSL